MNLIEDPERRAAARNRLSLEEYQEQVRLFAAFVAGILLPKPESETNTLNDPSSNDASQDNSN